MKTEHAIDEVAAEMPAAPELAERAMDLVREYPHCFWFWRPGASIESVGDVKLVIKNLREYGDRKTWEAARELQRCRP